MSIHQGEQITASDLTALKNRIITMYNNRTVSVNGQQLSNNSNTYRAAVNNASFSSGSPITSQVGDLINAVLVINDVPNLLWTSSGTNYNPPSGGLVGAAGYSNSTYYDLITNWLSNSMVNATGTSTTHYCRGACVGICTAGCSNTNRGTVGVDESQGSNWFNYSPSSTCKQLCGGNCSGDCIGTAMNNCGGQCTGQCATSCYGDCAGTCGNGCTGQCTGNCYNSCGGSCGNGCTSCQGCSGSCGANTCTGTCHGGCSTGCETSCKEQCATGCTSRCYGSATGGCYGCSGTSNMY